MKLTYENPSNWGKNPSQCHSILNIHALSWNQMQVFTTQGQQLTTWAKVWPLAWSFMYVMDTIC